MVDYVQAMNSACHPKLKRGFTLVELLVSLTILGILTSVAVPSLTALLIKYRLSNENTSLMMDFVLARGEAVNRGTTVSVCQSADGVTCSAAGWAAGRIVFVDQATPGVVDPGDVVLRVSPPTRTGDTMNPNAPIYLTYNAIGSPNANFTITTCQSNYVGSQLIVYPSGRIRAMKAGVCP